MSAPGKSGPWRTVALGEVASIERNAVQPEDISRGTFYLGLEHIESGGKILGAKPVDEGELASAKFCFTRSHVLYGKLRPYLAKIACPDFTGICSTDILPILPGPDLERRFLCYFLRQPSMVDYANSRASGANLPRLSPSVLEEFQIPLPPLAEQRRIAEVLDRAEALRAKRRAALAHLDTLTQSLFLDLFGEKLDAPAVDTKASRGRTPTGCEWALLTDVARLATGHTPDRNMPEYWDGDIPWISLTDIRGLDGRVAEKTHQSVTSLGIENSSAVRLPMGTVCFSRTASVGFVTVKVTAWLKRHPRFHLHFTPTSASWLNMVERFFRDLTTRRVRAGIFKSVAELETAIADYLRLHNTRPKPFIWTAKAADILAKVTRAKAALVKSRN